MKTHLSKIIATIFLASSSALSYADTQVCFTPGQDCESRIVAAVDAAKTTVLVQAYSFTSKPIITALQNAFNRGVKVQAILDKTDIDKSDKCIARILMHAGIVTYIDYLPNIQHNKVMIVDNAVVVTGSYNFTYNAQHENAENSLVISDPAIAKLYTFNWFSRMAVSKLAQDYRIS